MYFQKFPKIYYDFPNTSGNNTDLQILTDITTNIRIRKDVLENITIYDEYDILEGETPEMIAEKVYGDPELHWVIMLANQRYDYLKDFPMSSLEFSNYLTETYGEDTLDDIHHYEKNGLVVEALASLIVPSNVYDISIKGDFLLSSDSKTMAKIIDKSSNNNVSIMIDRGIFSAGNIVSLQGVRRDEAGNSEFNTLVNFTIAPNTFTLNSSYDPITNYMHELRINESKRRIKLISPDLINQILSEFETLLK